MKKQKLTYGLGINDADYSVDIINDGRQVICPLYVRWSNMLKRCYSVSFQKKNPTYIGCNVCEEWLTFSIFKKWMECQKWENMHLDKDILIDGNKTYSPDACVFVDAATNYLLTDHGRARGYLPTGVTRKGRKYRARCNVDNKTHNLGVHNTPEKAHSVYLNYKAMVVVDHASRIADIKVSSSLIIIADKMASEAESITNP